MKRALIAFVVLAAAGCSTPHAPDVVDSAQPRVCFPFVEGTSRAPSCEGASLVCKPALDACEPVGDVQGALPDASAPVDGQPGYLELGTMTFMSATEGRAPVKPYVEGRMTARGFVPTSRRVQR